MIVLPLAGIYLEEFSNAAALLGLSTGLIAGASRYGAVLADLTKRTTERATASGFFLGLGLDVLAIVSEYAS